MSAGFTPELGSNATSAQLGGTFWCRFDGSCFATDAFYAFEAVVLDHALIAGCMRDCGPVEVQELMSARAEQLVVCPCKLGEPDWGSSAHLSFAVVHRFLYERLYPPTCGL
jgi:hypothetical protein